MPLSPEIDFFAGADVVHSTEGRIAAPPWPGVCNPATAGEQGAFIALVYEDDNRQTGETRVNPGSALNSNLAETTKVGSTVYSFIFTPGSPASSTPIPPARRS